MMSFLRKVVQLFHLSAEQSEVQHSHFLEQHSHLFQQHGQHSQHPFSDIPREMFGVNGRHSE
jgi:hypothetical protein